MLFMARVFPEFQIVPDLENGIYAEFDQNDPKAIRLNRQLFDMIENGLAAGEGISHILYHTYVTIFHELGHWFNCAVSNFDCEIRLLTTLFRGSGLENILLTRLAQ